MLYISKAQTKTEAKTDQIRVLSHAESIVLGPSDFMKTLSHKCKQFSCS